MKQVLLPFSSECMKCPTFLVEEERSLALSSYLELCSYLVLSRASAIRSRVMESLEATLLLKS